MVIYNGGYRRKANKETFDKYRKSGVVIIYSMKPNGYGKLHHQ